MHQRIADHEVDQRRRHSQLLGNVLLRHAMQAVHLEGIAGALGQFVQRLGNVIQRGKVDVGGFGEAFCTTTLRPSSSLPEYFNSIACLR